MTYGIRSMDEALEVDTDCPRQQIIVFLYIYYLKPLPIY